MSNILSGFFVGFTVGGSIFLIAQVYYRSVVAAMELDPHL